MYNRSESVALLVAVADVRGKRGAITRRSQEAAWRIDASGKPTIRRVNAVPVTITPVARGILLSGNRGVELGVYRNEPGWVLQSGQLKAFQPKPIAATPPSWASRAPVAVSARTADGLELTGWFWAPEQPHEDILLFLPGRAGNRDIAAKQAEPFATDGRGVLVASYRGYGDNPGKPDENGLYQDGAAFADLARTLRPTGRLYLFGDGLGAAVALRLASRSDVSGTATLGAFDRFASFAPAITRPAYADAFDNVAAIARVKTPVLIMHGRKDQVVPFAAAETLKRAAGGTAVVAPIAGEAYHSVEFRYIAATVWQAFDHMGATIAGAGARSPSTPRQ